MTYKSSSFIVSEAVAQILEELPWGKRSEFINKCVLVATKNNPKQIMNNPELSLPNPKDEKLRTQESQSTNSTEVLTKPSDSSKTSSDPAASATTQSTDKSRNILKNLV